MAKEKSDEKVEKSATAEITYIPQDGDKPITKVGGVTFHANVPVQVGPAVKVMQLHVVPHTVGDRSGTRTIEVGVPLAEVLRGNPSFKIDGIQAERKRGTDRLPQSPEEYRGYATAWIAASTDLASVHTRWKVEEGLRQACGVDQNDVAYLKPFLDYKLALLGGSSAAA